MFSSKSKKVKQQARNLVNQYLELQKEQGELEGRLNILKKKIALFSKQSKIKTLKSKTHLLYVIRKLKTIFPKKNELGRERVELIMQQSSKDDFKHALKFDIIKLAHAYDKKRLSSQIMKQLKQYTKQEKFIKLSIREIKKKK